MGKRTLSKRELEEQRKKDDERAAAHVFQEFVETFQESPSSGSKVWVKAGTYDAGARKEDTKDKGKLYKPQSRLSNSQELLTSAERAQQYARMLSGDKKPERLGKKKSSGKSNLEAFKEELRQIQEEREERHKYKSGYRTPMESELDLFLKSGDVGSFDNGDPTTTNLYLGNLNPKITEQQLMEVFGRYGPLASIKIMWPRSDEEKARGRNCGFVAYMSRKDGERALRNLNGKDVVGYEMKLGWGKSVVIPPHPIYIPPVLLEQALPPPPSGLPFNAQPLSKDRDVLPQTQEELNEILGRSLVKVVMPTDRNLLMLIHRMVEFVIREGPMFEAMIMNRELNNPLFRFLFENQSPGHIYYRWKLYSVLHGDSQKEWNIREFRMFVGGSAWKPPLMNSYTTGMPDELVVEDEIRDNTKGSLSTTQRDRLEDLIRSLTPEARKIGEVMVFCIEHSDAAEEVAECILESLSNESTVLVKRIARLYLISDILHNCGVKVNKASFYRRAFEARLMEIMRQLRLTYDKLEGRLQAEGLKVRILRTLKAWEDSIYPKDFMNRLHNTFLGLVIEEDKESIPVVEQDYDGNPLHDQVETDDDIGVDLSSLFKGDSKPKLDKSPSPIVMDSDIDGYSIDDNAKSHRENNDDQHLSGFILSKWETVDPEQVEAQAMTTSKWDLLESSADNSQDSKNDTQESDPVDVRDMTEERRTKLREIEVKTVHYQDELESGQRSLKSGWTVQQQVEHYRRKLLRKSEKEKKEHDKEKERETTSKLDKHKRDWEKIEKDNPADDSHRKDKKSKKHTHNSPSDSSSKQRSKSKSPNRKRRASNPPSPHRVHRHSPPSFRSHHRVSVSPSNSAGRYGSSPFSSKHSRSSPPSPRSSRYSRRSPSPPSRYPSPTPSRNRHRDASPEVARKHKHKHRY